MDLLKIIFLGIIQGLTEFLPVSSSGHLVIFQNLFGIKTVRLTLDIFLHIGTVIPVIIIFWTDIKDIVFLKKEKRRLTWLILIGIIPTGLMGVLLEDFFTALFSSVKIVGYMLLITGLLLYLAERLTRAKRDISQMKWYNAIIVGIAQGFAIIPGISRSGSTIVASLFQGLDRESAARYSFLLSLPVILGAGVLELKDVFEVGLGEITWQSILAGTFASAVSGYAAIKYLLHILKKGRLSIFSFYCWGLGLLIILLQSI